MLYPVSNLCASVGLTVGVIPDVDSTLDAPAPRALSLVAKPKPKCLGNLWLLLATYILEMPDRKVMRAGCLVLISPSADLLLAHAGTGIPDDAQIVTRVDTTTDPIYLAACLKRAFSTCPKEFPNVRL